ncbi:c-type cytochrome [Rhodoferax sp.]|uniref:c-type cytochrome n=1 Tax=Rhodoferax sp. TaxID=50421 RepID=UPI0026188710|nr:c-type cytochrome [Rhodoferax sp.]MDD2919288.1 c-type cytochrome [Rhodoferax sp.]
MKSSYAKVSLMAVSLALCSGAVFAQRAKTDLGKMEFDANCAVCHGADGKGNGSLRELLRVSPTDLTQLAKKNQGILPMGRMYEVIDGANVPSHGTRDMPIWGRTYQAENAQNLLEARGSFDAQALVRARILALIEYINRLQVR